MISHRLAAALFVLSAAIGFVFVEQEAIAGTCQGWPYGGCCWGDCSMTCCNPNPGICPGDQCCYDLSLDVDNCGACYNVCSGNHIPVRNCNIDGICDGDCASGYDDCNSNKQSDGCEVNLTTDANNCGGCGAACSSNHITASCSGSTCNGTCNTGYTDCNSNKRSDGCEVHTSADVSNCGSCGHVCGATSSSGFACNSGVCQCNGITCGKDQDCVAGVCTCTAAHKACPGDTVATDCDRSRAKLDQNGVFTEYECFNYNNGVGPAGNACWPNGCGASNLCCPNNGGGTSCVSNVDNNNCFGCGNVCNQGGGYTCQIAHGCCWNGAQCQVPAP